MVKALQDASPGVRVSAVRALANFDPITLPASTMSARSPRCLTGPAGNTPDAARDAAVMLGKVQRHPERNSCLLQGLQNPLSQVRESSAAALGKFGAEARPALDALSKALADSDKNVRRQASLAIGSINSAPQ